MTLLLLFLQFTYASSARDFVPTVEKCQYLDGSFTISESTSLVFDEPLRDVARYLLDYIPFRSFSGSGSGSELCLRVDSSLSPESYCISVRERRMSIVGGDYAGVFNGVMTFFQLLPSNVYTHHLSLPVSVQCCNISDHPQFPYRGLCLDVARTWIPADAVKRYIDLLAYHKLNKLHFHLSDDEGWRVEIKSHPEFARIGGFRGGDSPVFPRYDKFDEKWGGYYTQEELKDIVQYARKRNIEVIPEIDMPGHSKALGAVCRDILCDMTPDTTRTNGLDIRNVWCVSKESNYTIIEDVVREMSAIFPSRHFHIGGDEVASETWSKCPSCRKLMARCGYRDARELQDYFISRVIEILNRYGKTPALWNDGIHGEDLSRETLICAWKNPDACRKVAGMGFPTVVMPGAYFYLDMKQSENEFGHNWAAIVDARKVHSFSFDKYAESELANVLGVSATFFSEIYIEHEPESPGYLDYMLFPRLCSVADVAWRNCHSAMSWDEFYQTLFMRHYERMTAMGISFRLFPPHVMYSGGCLTAEVDDISQIYYRYAGEWRRYEHGIRTSTPELYTFQSRCGSGRSFEVGSDRYYATQKPVTHVTSSMEFASDTALARVEQYGAGIVRTRRAAHSGDWIQYSFDAPVVSREISVQTGHVHLRRCLFLSGHVETSEDGVVFTDEGRLHNGGLKFTPSHPIVAVRVVCDSRSDAEDNVVVAPLTIR